MHPVTRCLLAGATLAAGLVPTLALAAPKAMLEKSATYALDSTIRSFRVPTQDSAGNIKYYDIMVTLTINAQGQPTGATLTSSQSPNPPTSGVIVPGTYRTPSGATCTVTNINLSNGRIQSFFTCANGSTQFQMSLATGSVANGHPFLRELLAAGIDKLSDVNTYTWGLTSNGNSGSIGNCNYFSQGYPVGAKTNGNQLILSAFNYISPADFICSATFVKQ